MNTKPFQVGTTNYAVNTDGAIVTVTQETVTAPLFTVAVDQTKPVDEAMKEVVAAVNTFFQSQFPNISGQFVAQFLAIFDSLVINVVDGVPVISIP